MYSVYAQVTALICGISTDFILNVYSNRVFIIITQNGKPGTLISVSLSEGSNSLVGQSISSRVLMGKRDDYIMVYAKKIGEMVCSRSSKTLLLALCIPDGSPEVFREVCQVSEQFGF